MSDPLGKSVPVSVVIPADNAARTLPETLASIDAQTVSPDEVIVVDDGSSDETPAIAERYGARVAREEHGRRGSRRWA